MNSNKWQNVFKIIMLIALTALITFMITTALTFNKSSNVRYIIASGDSSEIGKTLSSYEEFIKREYYGEIDNEKVIEGAIAGYVEGLDDKYSEYIPRKEMKDYLEQTNGMYSGIGAYITSNTQKDKVQIVTPIKNSPAERIGLKTGDLILKINGVEYNASQLNEASIALKGEEGTTVELEILRDEEVLKFTIERQIVKINHIESEVLENNIGYIEISAFDSGCYEEFKENFEKIRKDNNLKGLIIDLRNNGGGIVDEALKIADLIVKKDETLLVILGKNNSEEIKKSKEDPIITMPIVVLVNENTASASEILAASIKDNVETTKIVGKKSFGKGVIQTIFSLKDGGGLKLTTNEYLTPKRNKIHGVGIKPDYEVLLPDDKVIVEKREDDTQLKKAIELLK